MLFSMHEKFLSKNELIRVEDDIKGDRWGLGGSLLECDIICFTVSKGAIGSNTNENGTVIVSKVLWKYQIF